jgi:hypothetical protein
MFVNRCRIRFVPLPFFDPSNNVDASDASDDAFDDASNAFNAFMSVELSDLSNATQHTVASWPSTCCACTAAHAMPVDRGKVVRTARNRGQATKSQPEPDPTKIQPQQPQQPQQLQQLQQLQQDPLTIEDRCRQRHIVRALCTGHVQENSKEQ